MIRNLLEWKGKIYRVESCAACPARTTDTNGKSRCEIRGARLHARIKDPFPHVPANRATGVLACPVYREGTKRLAPKSERIDKIVLHEQPRVFGALYCSWCGMKIDPSKAVIVINDKEPNRIYNKFECLEEYLRTKN